MALVNTSFFTVPQTSPNDCLQHLCSQREYQFPVTLPGVSPRSVKSFRLLLLCWDSAYVRVCMCPLRAESLFHKALHLSCMEAVWPSEPDIIGAPLSLAGAPSQLPDVALRLLILGGTLCISDYPSYLWFACQSVGLGCITSLPSYLSCYGSFFITSAVENLSASLQAILMDSYSIIVVILVCPWQEVSSGSYYSALLATSSFTFL